jgi:hypothetical protein
MAIIAKTIRTIARLPKIRIIQAVALAHFRAFSRRR